MASVRIDHSAASVMGLDHFRHLTQDMCYLGVMRQHFEQRDNKDSFWSIPIETAECRTILAQYSDGDLFGFRRVGYRHLLRDLFRRVMVPVAGFVKHVLDALAHLVGDPLILRLFILLLTFRLGVGIFIAFGLGPPLEHGLREAVLDPLVRSLLGAPCVDGSLMIEAFIEPGTD